MKIIKSIYFITLLTYLLLSNSAYSGVCERHIYNNSNADWKFHFVEKTSGYKVKVNAPCTNDECIIAAKKIVSIEYSHFGRYPGTVYIVDKNNNSKYFYFNNQRPWSACPTIYHEGNTGSVSLNQPAGADFIIEKDVW